MRLQVRKIITEVQFFLSFEDGQMILNLAMSINSVQEPYLDESLTGKQELSQEFLAKKKQEEQLLIDFLSKYYEMLPTQRYTKPDKVCRIKEIRLSDDECI